MDGRKLAALAGLAGLVAVALLVDLGRPDFWDPGESRYAEAVREMGITGRWIEPTLGYAEYADKPPTYLWLVAAAFRFLGTSEWAARLPSALAGILTIVATVAFAWRRLGVAAALAAGAVLATSAQFVAIARSVRMDALLTLLVSVALFQAYALWAGDRRTAARTWLLALCPALGLLVKGPIAVVLPVLVVGAMVLLTGERGRLARLRPGAGAAAALVLVVVWYAVGAILAPEYVRTFLWTHNVGRFLSAAAGHGEPLLYYTWVLPVTFLPWALFLPGALTRAVHRARRGHDLDLFLLMWCGTAFAFFSISSAKLATYLLPIFPALALLVGTFLDRVRRAPPAVQARALATPLLVWTVGIAAVALATPIGVAVRWPGYVVPALAALLLVPFAVLGWRTRARGEWRRVPALVLLGALVTQGLFYRVGVPVVNEFTSLRGAAAAASSLPPEARVVAYKTRGHSFAFYAERTLERVRSPHTAAEMLEADIPTAVLTKTRYLHRIQAHLDTPVCIWWQGPSGRVLLANVPRPDAHHAGVLAPARTTAGPHTGRRVAHPPRC